MQQPTTPANSKCIESAISSVELERAVRATISRSAALRQSMLRVRKSIKKEVDRVRQLTAEINKCLARIDETEASCRQVQRGDLAPASSDSEMDSVHRLQELRADHNEESQLLSRMMQTRESHTAAHRELTQRLGVLHKDWVRVKERQCVLAVVLQRRIAARHKQVC